MIVNRRSLLSGAGAAVLAAPVLAARPFAPPMGPRSRVVYVNDLAGDIDGLFATVHLLLSPAIDLRAIVGSRAQGAEETAANAAALGREMLGLMGMTGKVPVHAGAASKIAAPGKPQRAPGVQAIIDEAMRNDTTLPLYVAVGGGLTEVASALMLEPRIAGRFTLAWIGGMPVSGKGGSEYNQSIDPIATQHVFNQTEVPIWQISNEIYATCQISDTELQAFVAPCGAIGAWLYDKVLAMSATLANRYKFNTGESWTLGDSPLVVLTTLNDWVPNAANPLTYTRTGSSRYEEVPTPRVNLDGTYQPRPDARRMRAYRSIDTRMMFSDFFAKLSVNFRG
jgi:inosine-uridine nucleoside N-ribohydrolase